MNRFAMLLLLPPLPLCLAACASSDTYPSLARRPAERVTGTAQVASPESRRQEAPPPSPGFRGRVEQLLRQARAAHAEFQANRESTRRAVAAATGSARASESWVAAQVALATLESARNDAVTALAEIDQLYADERVAVPEIVSPTAELLGSARDQLRAWVDEENDLLSQLAGQLRA